MKKLLFILTVAFAISCTKENNLRVSPSSKRLANIDNVSGTYTGHSYYTNYYSLDPTIGLGDESGVDSGYALIVDGTPINGYDLSLSYIAGGDTTTIYATDIMEENGQIYFNIPTQLNEDNQEIFGDNCQYATTGTYDGMYVISTQTLVFCTHYQIGNVRAYGTTNETYTKQ